ncbi:hypothetical protein SAMN04487981_14226 [Streptomyces sp. cf386]|uniref:hypothetical protein n=1 Tax=Streptomyces sp. cf386 TaxID=1761904 RepID=UPI0008916534|nr:hypothetical protein [Streptomyces sp. cf386]SDP80154.1 hypothetical protein SAMN04487981_14226 [Streptomyces sp. cf386]
MRPTQTEGTVDALVVEHAPREGPYAIGTALKAAGLPVRVYRTWAGTRCRTPSPMWPHRW